MKTISRNWIKHKFPFKLIGSLVVLGLLLITLASSALALEGREGQEIVIGADEVIADDLYATADTFILEGVIDGDLFVTGRSIRINGTVTGDLWAAGQIVTLNGVVEDDARLAGAVLELGSESRVGDDLFVGGNSLEAQPGSEVQGSLFFGGMQALLAGTMDEDLFVGSYGLALQGPVAGNVTAEVGAPDQGIFFNPVQFIPELPPVPKVSRGLTLGREATIGGDLTYTSAQASEIPAGVVAGEVTFTPGAAFGTPVDVSPGALLRQAFIGWLTDNLGRLVALVIVGLLLAWLAPAWLLHPAQTLERKPWPSLGWGALTVILFPLVVLALIATIIVLALLLGVVTFGKLGGSVAWLGLVLILALLVGVGLLATYFTKLVVGYWGGHLLLARVKPDWAEKPMISLLVGLVILVLLTAIPVIGWFLSFAITIFGLGVLWVMWRGERERPAAVEPRPALA